MFGIKSKIKIIKCKHMGIKLGKNVELGDDIFWGSEPYLISIGENCRISSKVNFITHDGGLWTLRNLNKLKNADYIRPIIIGNNVNIGMNATIMPGVEIGNNCIIGFGSVVTKNVPNNTIVAGVPAAIIETLDEYYNKKINQVDYIKNLNNKEKKKYLINKWKMLTENKYKII